MNKVYYKGNTIKKNSLWRLKSDGIIFNLDSIKMLVTGFVWLELNAKKGRRSYSIGCEYLLKNFDEVENDRAN